MKYIYIILGGASGSLLRFLLSEYISTKFPTAFPTGIFSVNMIGALLIGFLFGLFSVNGLVEDKVRFLVFVGFLGGFTTFSSFALENMRLLKDGLLFTAVFYVLLSNIGGIALAFAGYSIGLKMNR